MQTTDRKVIGVLGGMGPETSIRFYKQLIDIARSDYSAVQDKDFPPIFLYNLPLIDFDESGVTNVDTVRDQLVAGVKMLEQAGSDFIVTPCNSVHYFIEDMRKAVNIQVVSIIEETVKSISKDTPKVGVLSSASTREMKLYADELEKQGFEAILATDAEQEILNQLILQVMRDDIRPIDIENFASIMGQMQSRGALSFIVGCTELSLIPLLKNITTLVSDSMQILAKNAIYKCYNAV